MHENAENSLKYPKYPKLFVYIDALFTSWCYSDSGFENPGYNAHRAGVFI